MSKLNSLDISSLSLASVTLKGGSDGKPRTVFRVNIGDTKSCQLQIGKMGPKMTTEEAMENTLRVRNCGAFKNAANNNRSLWLDCPAESYAQLMAMDDRLFEQISAQKEELAGFRGQFRPLAGKDNDINVKIGDSTVIETMRFSEDPTAVPERIAATADDIKSGDRVMVIASVSSMWQLEKKGKSKKPGMFGFTLWADRVLRIERPDLAKGGSAGGPFPLADYDATKCVLKPVVVDKATGDTKIMINKAEGVGAFNTVLGAQEPLTLRSLNQKYGKVLWVNLQSESEAAAIAGIDAAALAQGPALIPGADEDGYMALFQEKKEDDNFPAVNIKMGDRTEIVREVSPGEYTLAHDGELVHGATLRVELKPGSAWNVHGEWGFSLWASRVILLGEDKSGSATGGAGSDFVLEETEDVVVVGEKRPRDDGDDEGSAAKEARVEE